MVCYHITTLSHQHSTHQSDHRHNRQHIKPHSNQHKHQHFSKESSTHPYSNTVCHQHINTLTPQHLKTATNPFCDGELVRQKFALLRVKHRAKWAKFTSYALHWLRYVGNEQPPRAKRVTFSAYQKMSRQNHPLGSENFLRHTRQINRQTQRHRDTEKTHII